MIDTIYGAAIARAQDIDAHIYVIQGILFCCSAFYQEHGAVIFMSASVNEIISQIARRYLKRYRDCFIISAKFLAILEAVFLLVAIISTRDGTMTSKDKAFIVVALISHFSLNFASDFLRYRAYCRSADERNAASHIDKHHGLSYLSPLLFIRDFTRHISGFNTSPRTHYLEERHIKIEMKIMILNEIININLNKPQKSSPTHILYVRFIKKFLSIDADYFREAVLCHARQQW